MGNMVYVAVALTDYEASTVMAVFDSEAAAHQYLDLYRRHKGAKSGPDYKADYDDYKVLPVELNAIPFRYGNLAAIRPSQGKIPCVCCGIRANVEDGGDGRFCHICIGRGHHTADDDLGNWQRQAALGSDGLWR